MRWVICALAVLAFAPRAFADDFDILRGALPVGPATFTNWSGFYFGGQAGYSGASAEFGGATQPLLGYSTRELLLETDDAVSTWPVLGGGSSHAVSFGGFGGYNTQFQDLILGIEADYTQASFGMTSQVSPLGRQVTAGSYSYDVDVTGSGSLHIDEYASVRARAGYVLGNFLPYGFAGVAVGVGNYSVTSLISGQQNLSSATPPVLPCTPSPTSSCVNFSYPNSATKNPAYLYGFTVGGGIDFALTANIFLRGEFEYVQFSQVAGITAGIYTARVGAGLKF